MVGTATPTICSRRCDTIMQITEYQYQITEYQITYTDVNITSLTCCRDYCYSCFTAVATHRHRQQFLHVHCVCIVVVCIYTCFLHVLLKHDLCYEILTWYYKIYCEILWDMRYENYVLCFFRSLNCEAYITLLTSTYVSYTLQFMCYLEHYAHLWESYGDCSVKRDR